MKNIQKTARMTGFLYFMMVPLGIFGILYLPSFVFVEGDMAATLQNILAQEMTFRLSLYTSLVLQVCHIFIVMLLYKLLKPVNRKHALYMVIFMLASVPISMINELNHLAVLFLARGDFLPHFTEGQRQDLMALFINLREHGINISSIFWGLWLLPMGYLVIKSGFIPKILGYILILGCFGYLADTLMVILMPHNSFLIGDYTGWGEILFPLWLMIKGVKTEVWETHAVKSAEQEA